MNQLRTCACVLGTLLLAGCTAAAAAEPGPAHPARASGHVTGRLLMEGGPISLSGKQPGERPIPGTVTFTAAGHRTVFVHAGTSGKFSAWLPPARYRVTGRSPEILTVTASGKTEELPCSQPLSVTVTARHAVTISVVCIVP